MDSTAGESRALRSARSPLLPYRTPAADAAPGACASGRDRSGSRRSPGTRDSAFRSRARRRAADSPRTAGSSPAVVADRDAPPPAKRRCRRIRPFGLRPRDKRNRSATSASSPLSRHCATDSRARSMPCAATPVLAHQFQKLAAAAADIEHVVGNWRRTACRTPRCGGHTSSGPRKRSAKRRSRSRAVARRCGCAGCRGTAVRLRRSRPAARCRMSRSSSWISRSYSCADLLEIRPRAASEYRRWRGRARRDNRRAAPSRFRGSSIPSASTRCWKAPCRSATLRRN